MALGLLIPFLRSSNIGPGDSNFSSLVPAVAPSLQVHHMLGQATHLPVHVYGGEGSSVRGYGLDCFRSPSWYPPSTNRKFSRRSDRQACHQASSSASLFHLDQSPTPTRPAILKTVTKVKGFTINGQVERIVNFSSMVDLLFKGGLITVCYPHSLKRVKRKFEIHECDLSKRLRKTYDKRRVNADYTTLPFGFSVY